MSWSYQESQESQEYYVDANIMAGMNQRMQEARGYYAEEHSEVSVIILHMSELLSSFVREDTPQKRAQWSQALAAVRDGMVIHPSHDELRFITDFSVMLEEGLQCIADKCARLEQAVQNAAAREQEYAGILETRARLLKRQHESKAQLVACDLCDSSIPRLRFYNHLRNAHPKEFEKVAKFRCEYCKNALFIKEPAFRGHLEVCEKRLEYDRMNARMPPSHQLICRMCELECSTLKDLAEHSEKAHPQCQILSCTGCGQLYRHPDQILEHWRLAKEKFKHMPCAATVPAVLVPRTKLISQMVAKAKASGGDKNFASIACMTQIVACQECDTVCEAFHTLYNHIHRLHTKVVHASLSFGCLGCGIKFKCAPSLREHLLRNEIEGIASCRNAGAAYWDEKLISKDLRPTEADDKANETMLTAVEMEEKDEAKAETKALEEWMVNMESPPHEEEQLVDVGGPASVKMEVDEEPENRKITIKLKRTPAGIAIDGGGHESMNDMPSLDRSE